MGSQVGYGQGRLSFCFAHFGEAMAVLTYTCDPDLAGCLSAAVIPSLQRGPCVHTPGVVVSSWQRTVRSGSQSLLILFAIVLDKFTHSFPDISQMTSETLPALGPITVTSNHWLGPTNVSSLGHPAPGEGTHGGIRAGRTCNNCA